MPIGAQLDEELLKRITGGDQIPSRGLYEKFVYWRPQCVIWIGTNHLPRFNSDDDAVWRRVRTIPMNTIIRFSGQDEKKGFARHLILEANGILNWILDGLKEYRRQGGLGEPTAVTSDINSYRTDSDTVASWLGDGLANESWALDSGHYLPLAVAYNSYVAYCQDDGTGPFNKKRFTKRIQSVNSDITIAKRGGQQCVVGLRQLPPGK
jgi:putative DNA primase/helicase